VKERDRPDAVRTLSEVKPTSKHGDEDRRRYFVAELRSAYRDNVSPGRATVRYKKKYGEEAWPKQAWKRGAILGDEPSPDLARFWRYLSVQAQRRGGDTKWAHKQWKAELGTDIAPPLTLHLPRIPAPNYPKTPPPQPPRVTPDLSVPNALDAVVMDFARSVEGDVIDLLQ